jgi:hypothetical protein
MAALRSAAIALFMAFDWSSSKIGTSKKSSAQLADF